MTRSEEPIGEATFTNGDNSCAGPSTPGHVTSLIRYIALAFIGGCFVAISKGAPRDSAAFDWSNRIGRLLLLTLTITYAISDVWASLAGKRSGEPRVDRWVPVVLSLAIPCVLLLKGWDRVLDALWLK